MFFIDMPLLIRLGAVYVATTFFALMFNAPKKELLFCGLAGFFGWLAYEISSLYLDSEAITIFISTMAVTALSRRLSFVRKQPISVYLISGIIPLVPGFLIYYTVYNMISEEVGAAVLMGIETLRIAGSIALGIMAIFVFPYKVFNKKMFSSSRRN
ncbi:MAG: threonine/serine exporter family protein [Defluviitaleaceae bacterium]|nr:threonine/serine exporter family protein [Defluviitaleaceae bacterium]